MIFLLYTYTMRFGTLSHEEIFVNEIVNRAVQLAEQGLTWIFQFLRLIWRWSFGEIIAVFRIPFATLPLWKQILYVLAALAITYFIFRIAMAFLEAALRIFRAMIDLMRTIVEEIPDALIAGFIALICAWVIHNVHVAYLDSLRF